jgi:hypothetical protein
MQVTLIIKEYVMLLKWINTLILCLSLSFIISSCGGDDTNNQSVGRASETLPDNTIILSVDKIGPINAQTPFNIHHFTLAFKKLNVSQQTSFQEGEAYPVIRVAKGAKNLMTINPTADQNGIYSVVIEDNLIHNQLGHPLSTPFSDIYAEQKAEKCLAGQEELSGKTICYAPRTHNILYIFTGKWNGPDGKIPPTKVLSTWALDSIIWKPIE